MNEFQLGLKLQVSGAEAVQTALGEVTKKLGDQLTGIQEFTTKLGEGNESVRGYIQSAKNLIEQNPIQETLGKLSGLAQAIGLEKVSDGIKSTAGSLKSWTGEITGFLGQTEKASRLIKGVLEGDVSGAIGKVKQNLASMSTVGGIAKALGLESVVTSAQQTRDSVEAMTGKLREFGSGAGSAGEIVKRVLLTDTNGAIGVVRTGLQSMGNFADLATRMGLHGVAGEIDSIAKKAGEWTGKIEEFSTRSTQAGEKLNTSFGGTLPPAMSKAAGALLELTGTSDKLLPFLDGMQQQFQALTGKSFPEAFKGMQGLSKEFGNGGNIVGKFGEILKTPLGPSQMLAGGLGIVGAAVAGWQIGKAIGDMDLFGVKINDVAQYSIAKGMEAFEKFKGWLHINTKEETEKATKAWRDTAEQATMIKPEPKKTEAAAGGGFDQKKFDQEQLKESQRRAAEANADIIKEQAEKQANQQLATIEKTLKENTNIYDTTLNERLAAADQAEKDSIKVLQEREAAAGNALDVRIKNINDRMAEVAKSDDSKEVKETKRNQLQTELAQLNNQKQTAHEQSLKEQADITKKYDDLRLQDALAQQKRDEEQKKQAAETAKKKAEEEAKAQADAAKKQEEDRKKAIEQIELENKKLDEQIKKWRELEGKTKDKKEKEGLQKKIHDANGQKKPLPGQVNAPKGQPAGDGLPGGEAGKKGDAAEDPKDKAKQVLTLGQQIQQTFDDIANTGIKSVQDSITGVINGTMTWKDALSHIGSTVINSVMNAFSKMITDQITQYMAVDTVKATTSTAEIGRAQAETAAKSPLALLDSISTWGFAATIGLSALMAAMNAIGGFESGGYTGDGGRSEVAGLVHRGEMVFDQPAVQAIGKDRLDAMRMNRAMPTGLTSGGAGGGGVKPMAPNINVQSAQPKVIVVNSQEELMKVMKGSIGEEITVAHIAKNKLRLGMAS